MSIYKYLASVLFLLLAAACSGKQAPQAAAFVPPAESSVDFGDLRVHYNALPTMSLGDAVAAEYGVRKDPDTGMVVIALRTVAGDTELAAQGEVSAVAYDLQGTQQRIEFKTVATGDYTDHLGVFEMNARDTYRFEVTVKSAGRTETVKFQRSF
jgi:hypothetical protein